MEHEVLVATAKSWGLFYLVGLSVGVLIYSLWPSQKKVFDQAANSIFEEKDKPCR